MIFLARYDHRLVLVLDINPPGERIEYSLPGATPRHDKYQELTLKVVADARVNDPDGVKLIESSRLADELGIDAALPDGYHFSAKAHRRMAEMLAGEIEPWIASLALNERGSVDVGVVTWNTRDLTVDALRRLLDTRSRRGHHAVRARQRVDRRHARRDRASEVPEARLDVGANVGFGAGMNTLIARSTSPWFFCLNSDAWPEPGALATLVAAAVAHPRAAAVAPRVERPDGALEFSTHPFPSARVAAVVNLGLHRALSPTRKADLLLDGWWRHDDGAPRRLGRRRRAVDATRRAGRHRRLRRAVLHVRRGP